jgi:pyruvate dehydrogenase E1 component alpha subunit
MGSYAIVGAHLAIANGAAWSAKLRGTDQVAVCFFGDGATNIGAFHESLNLAAVWALPVVFVCENNQWMEYTPIGSVTAVPRPAADRAAAYGLEPIVVDGNEVDAWLARDPVWTYRDHLLGAGVAEQALTAIEAAALREVDAATEAAKGSPVPSADLVLRDVWADGSSTWRN